MKHKWNSQRWFRSALVGLGLVASATVGLAAPDLDLGTFDAGLGDANAGPNIWGKGWGSSTVEWDGNQDSTGNGGGSLYVYGPFDRANSDTPLMLYGITSGNPWWHPNPPFDMTLYTSLEFDIKWNADPANMSIATFNSPPGGGVQGLEIHACPDGAGGPVLTNLPIPDAAANGWTHVSVPINPAMSGLGEVYGVWFNKWLPTTNDPITFGFWLDNVVLKGTDAPPPPPTVALDLHAVPGLAFVSASGGQYDRQEIRTVGTNYSWIGASGSVSYSIDVAKIGENAPAPTGYTLFMHFVPGTPDPTRPDSDWHEANVLMWTIGNSADGSAWSQLRYKTNSFESNGDMWGSGGFPGGVWNPTPAGTWTITFEQDTNIVITSDSGSITNILPPEVVAIFKAAGPGMQINIGGTPGELSRLGQMAVITRARITGTPGEPNVDSNFLNVPRDTNVWQIVASSANYGVQEIPTGSLWVNWTLPANGYSLQTKATLDPGAWKTPTSGGYEAGALHYVLLRPSDLPGTDSSYFRLLKRGFTRLQILMPGETAAPGTPTGKTGTPTPQPINTPFSLIVNAVDDEWYPIKGINDTISLISDDPSWGGMPMLSPDPTLVNGTAIVNDLYMLSEGTWKITVTDVTDPTKTADTSTATPATP